MAVDYRDMQSTLHEGLGFREMCQDDLTYVIDIELRAYTHPWTLGIFRDCLRVGYRCWVVEYQDKVIGYGIALIAAEEAHILNLCIDPEYHGSGFGRALLEFLIEQSRHAGAEMILLEVRKSNRIAIDLYLSAGFNELGTRRDYYPADDGREDAIIFARYIE